MYARLFFFSFFFLCIHFSFSVKMKHGPLEATSNLGSSSEYRLAALSAVAQSLLCGPRSAMLILLGWANWEP